MTKARIPVRADNLEKLEKLKRLGYSYTEVISNCLNRYFDDNYKQESLNFTCDLPEEIFTKLKKRGMKRGMSEILNEALNNGFENVSQYRKTLSV